jgi:hypothetical protein
MAEADRERYRRVSRLGHEHANPWIRKSSAIDGWLFEGEHELLWELASAPTEGDVLEIGSWEGKSSCILAGALVDAFPANRLFCIDTFCMDGIGPQSGCVDPAAEGSYYRFLRNARAHGFSDQVVVLADRSERVIPHLSIRLKLAFLDGTHLYHDTARDIELVKPMIQPGGFIALHDSGPIWPEVELAIRDHLATDERFQFHRKVSYLECWVRSRA